MPLRIFVIDDEECIRDSTKWHLEDLGHQVLTAPDPTGCPVYGGHDCANDFPCAHMLLIDYYLPTMNALDFIEMMTNRGCKGMTRHKFIMSGDITHMDRERASQLGCQVFQKPLTFDVLDVILTEVEAHTDTAAPLAKL